MRAAMLLLDDPRFERRTRSTARPGPDDPVAFAASRARSWWQVADHATPTVLPRQGLETASERLPSRRAA